MIDSLNVRWCEADDEEEDEGDEGSKLCIWPVIRAKRSDPLSIILFLLSSLSITIFTVKEQWKTKCYIIFQTICVMFSF